MPWDKVHVPASAGGLGMTCAGSRAQAYWLGLRLCQHVLALAAGPHAEYIPPSYADLGQLLTEVIDLDDLANVSAKRLSSALTSTLPHPKNETQVPPLDWNTTL
jgi:hypothetical protein